MDFGLVSLIATLVLGSGGIVGFVSELRRRKAKKDGVPADEGEARNGAQMNDLAQHYQRKTEALQREIDDLRSAMRAELQSELEKVRRHVERLERWRLIDAKYIDDLENHIWQGKPPPPPPRPQYPGMGE